MNFLDSLANSLLRIIERDSLSYEKLANKCKLSTRFITNIINRKSAPTIKTLQKMCKSIGCTPNDLLLPGIDEEREYRIPMRVKDYSYYFQQKKKVYYINCPRCTGVIDRDYQKFCACCGQKLSWVDF